MIRRGFGGRLRRPNLKEQKRMTRNNRDDTNPQKGEKVLQRTHRLSKKLTSAIKLQSVVATI
jgi:hypothetical protein